jgi:hypothetical protein
MNRQTKDVILFILIFFWLALLLDTFLKQGIRLSTKGEHQVWMHISQGHINSEIIISGGSRALTGLDCRILQARTYKSCYNIALNGNALDLQLERLKLYLKYQKKPDMIIQVVGRNSLAPSTPYNPVQFFPYLHEKELYKTLIRLDPIFFKTKYIPLYGFARLGLDSSMEAVKGLLGQREDMDVFDQRIRGFVPVMAQWNDDFTTFKKLYPQGLDGRITEQGRMALSELMELCQKNQIQLVVIFAPMYYEAHAYIRNLKELLAFYTHITQENGVVFWNYVDHEITQNQDLFYNSQHFNYKGAWIFSHMIADKINHLAHRNQGQKSILQKYDKNQ